MKTGDQLAHPGACMHELEAAILTLQYSVAYAKVSPEPTQAYLFDPGTYAMKDPALLTSGYTLEPGRLLEYGMLATRLRQDLVQRSEALREADEGLATVGAPTVCGAAN